MSCSSLGFIQAMQQLDADGRRRSRQVEMDGRPLGRPVAWNGRHRLQSASAGCIHSAGESAHINWTAKLRILRVHSLSNLELSHLSVRQQPVTILVRTATGDFSFPAMMNTSGAVVSFLRFWTYSYTYTVNNSCGKTF